MRSTIKKIPFAKQVYQYFKKAQYQKRFEHDAYGCFWGVFDTLEQASQAAPQTKTIGYDSAELAQEYRQMIEQNNWENTGRTIASYDYPVLFWLKLAFSEGGTQVFDFGGNVGIHYYLYSKYLNYPENLKWLICEVPEILKVGEELAKHRGVSGLEFTPDFSHVGSADIFIASGSIQYVKDLAAILSAYENKPKYLLINRLPLYDGKQFVTLQNGGKVFYPQYVFNKNEFIGGLQKLGYELIDLWEDRNDSCLIPFYPERSVPVYSGLYLKLGA